MNDTKIVSEMLGGILIQLPVLVVCLVGIMVALISWCILIPISQQTMLRMMKESGVGTRVTANIVFGLAWSVLRAVSYVLLLVGVYAGRKSTSATPPPLSL